MPIQIRVEVQGLDRLISRLHSDATLAPPIRAFFRDSAKTVWSEVVRRTPRRTGNLQQHLFADVDQAAIPRYARVGFQPLKYAPLVEFGTGLYNEAPGANRQPIEIYPKHKRALAFEINGKRLVRRKVVVKGMQPRRMLRDGWQASLPRVRALLGRAAAQIGERWQGPR